MNSNYTVDYIYDQESDEIAAEIRYMGFFLFKIIQNPRTKKFTLSLFDPVTEDKSYEGQLDLRTVLDLLIEVSKELNQDLFDESLI
jgi:hypothetical protein